MPQTIIISILAFNLFDCAEYCSKHQPLEVSRNALLTDKMVLQYYELPKLPEVSCVDDELELWLTLFNAKTEEDLAKLEALEVPVMKKAIGAYRTVTATDEFKEIERQRHYSACNRASALGHARREERENGRALLRTRTQH